MDIVTLCLVGVCLIISIISLIITIKSKSNNTNDEEISKQIAEIEKNQIDTAKYIYDFENRISNNLNNLSVRVNNELNEFRKEISSSQSNQRQELQLSINSMTKSIADITSKMNEANTSVLQFVQQGLADMQRSQSESLEKIRESVDEKLSKTLSERLGTSFKSVSDQLENVYKSLGEVKELSNGVNSLNKVFSNVKVRGTWAEVQLDDILAQTIPGKYVKNFKPESNSGKIVEFAIKIPSQDNPNEISYLPIDSKFPIEDYIRIVDASEQGDSIALEEAKKAFDTRILAQAKDISKYLKPPVTLPFAIMYLATEGLYCEAINSKSGIVEKCQNEYNVMIAGPSTITALLNSLSLGFKAITINQKTEEIRKLLVIAKKQYELFQGELAKVQKSINSASDSIEQAVKRNNTIVKKLHEVENFETEYYNISEFSEES